MCVPSSAYLQIVHLCICPCLSFKNIFKIPSVFITVLKMNHIDFIEKNLNYSEASLVSKMQLRNLVND